MKHIILTIFLFGVVSSTAQTSINDYKYIIVPKKFDGFKNENQYGTSTLIKHLFTQKGFSVVYDDELPEDLNKDRCLGLLVGLDERSSLFSTKTALVLKDCNSAEILSSIEGKSKEKDYKLAFHEAIRKAFKSFEALNYSYEPSKGTNEPVTISFKNDVKKLDESKADASKGNKRDPMIEQEATVEQQSYKSMKPVPSDYKKAKVEKDKDPVLEQVATKENQSNNKVETKPSIVKKEKEQKDSGVLYAQQLPNGFQLVDSSPKIQMKIFRTSLPDYFLAEAENKNGVLYAKNGKWYFEYYLGEELIVDELDIKF